LALAAKNLVDFLAHFERFNAGIKPSPSITRPQPMLAATAAPTDATS
jgi:hypothetical protein